MSTTVRASASAGANEDDGADAVESVDLSDAAVEHRDAVSAMRAKSGLVLQQAAGVGSRVRLTLDGLSDARVRLFVDGVPLALTGFGGNLAEVPLALVRRMDVHRGVTPVSLSSDALGGAINLVTHGRVRRTRLSTSSAVGSFGQVQSSLLWRQAFPALQTATHVLVAHQRAKNDAFVDVDVANSSGQLEPRRVRRFHNAFASSSVQVGGTFWGVLGAERLAVNAFHQSTARDVGHNLTMTQPYGEVAYASARQGATLRYVDADITPWGTGLRVAAAFSRRQLHLQDVTTATYNWLGEVVAHAGGGEIGPGAQDVFLVDDNVFARATLRQELWSGLSFEASVAPHVVRRKGRDLAASPLVPDPQAHQRQQMKLSSGASLSWASPRQRMQTQAFVKGLTLRQNSQEVAFSGARLVRRVHQTAVGAGVASSMRITDGWHIKGSGEWAHRAPEPNEVFGDGVLVQPSLLLQPESSLNANLTSVVVFRLPMSSSISLRSTAFMRRTHNLTVLASSGTTGEHKNLGRADTHGASLDVDVTTLGDIVFAQFDATAFDKRNRSKQGVFADTYGDRVPNEPWLTATSRWGARLRWSPSTSASCSVRTAYTRGFFVGFESQGQRDSKRRVPSQLWHDVGCRLHWATRSGPALDVAASITNVTDARLFDFFGVQRPGRGWLLSLQWTPT